MKSSASKASGSNRTATLQKAARLAEDGALAPALNEYLQLFAQDPSDWTVANAVGDLHLRMGRIEEGVAHFMDLAERVAHDGFTTKARALYRKILRVQPDNEAASSRVAELQSQHLDSSPFMNRLLDTVRSSRAAAAPQAAAATGAVHVPPQQAPPVAPPVAAPDSPAESEAFELPPCDWIPTCAALAALPLPDDASPNAAGAEDPRTAAAFRRLQVPALSAATARDFKAAADGIERFLSAFPHYVPALETLIDLGVEGQMDHLASFQVRLANVCLETGRFSRARQVTLDLLCRYPADPRTLDLIGRVSALAPAKSPSHATPSVTDTPDSDVGAIELFDDDGLVTGDVRRAEDRLEAVRPNAVDASAARDALARADRLSDAGNVTAALALLEELMETTSLRPFVGVRLAQLYREEGDCVSALRSLELTAEQPPLDEDSSHELAYEVALTLEAMGNRQDALGVYHELLSEAGPAFRDVAARADQLSAA